MKKAQDSKTSSKEKISEPHETKATSKIKKKSSVPFLEYYVKYILIGLIIIGVFLRLAKLGYLSFWVDEYVHVNAGTEMINSWNPFVLFRHELNGVIVSFFSGLGFLLFGHHEIGGRIFNAILSCSLIPTVYWFGKRFFTLKVGLIAALLATFSQYLIFWSRLDRMYGVIAAVYLLPVGYCIIYTLDIDYKKILPKKSINTNNLLILLALIIFSFLASLITYFLFFSLGAWALYLVVSRFKQRKALAVASWNKWIILSGIFIIFLITSLTPLNKTILKPLFSLAMPDSIVQLLLPDMENVMKNFKAANWADHFKTYFNVILTDMPGTIYFAIAAFIPLLILARQKAMIIACFYIFPLLLMGFVYLEPNLPRYHSFLYPMYLILVACFFEYIPLLINKFILPKSSIKFLSLAVLPLLIGMIIYSKMIPNAVKITTNDHHGIVIDKKLSVWSFTNWKGPSKRLKQLIKKGDVVFSTVPAAVSFYLQDTSIKVHLFRQIKLNAADKSYIPIGDGNGVLPSASSYNNFYRTLQSSARIWLISDYYLYNSLTDPNTRALLFNNFELMPELGKDGDVQVFLFDRYSTAKKQHSMIYELGKPAGRKGTPALSFTTDAAQKSNGLLLKVISKGIDSGQEAIFQINGTQSLFIPHPTGKTSDQLDISEVKIPGNLLNIGTNSFEIGYNENTRDSYRGFIVYDVIIQ